MNKLISCHYNMDTNRVEARFEDGTTLAIDCIAVEDEYGNTPAQRAELGWLLYHKPLEYAQLVLGGEIEHYLSLGCEHGRLEDEVQRNNKSRQVFYKVGTCRDSFLFDLLFPYSIHQMKIIIIGCSISFIPSHHGNGCAFFRVIAISQHELHSLLAAGKRIVDDAGMIQFTGLLICILLIFARHTNNFIGVALRGKSILYTSAYTTVLLSWVRSRSASIPA